MTDLSELKAKYAALGAEIERLEAKPAVNDGPLTEAPEVGTVYWTANTDGYIESWLWDDDGVDHKTLAQGQVYPNLESAEKPARKDRAEQKIRTIIAKHAPGWRADWADVGQEKARLAFGHEAKRWHYITVWTAQIPGVIHFPPHLFDTILSEMGDSMGDLL